MSQKVLHLFTNTKEKNAERTVLTAAKLLNAKGIESHFCLLSEDQLISEEKLKTIGGNCYHFKKNKFIALYKLLRKEQFDVVHCHNGIYSASTLFAAKLAGIKKRIINIEPPYTNKAYSLTLSNKLKNDFIYLFATDIIASSKQVFDKYWPKHWQNDNRCQIIYNGIKNKDFYHQQIVFWERYHLQINIPKIIHPAPMSKEKNQLFLIDVLAEYVKRFGPAYLIFVGKENQQIKQALISKAKEHQCDNFLVFLGDKPDSEIYHQHANIMVYAPIDEPSLTELLQSAATGIPIVTSAISGISEIAEQLSSVNALSLTAPTLQWAASINLAYRQPKEERAINHNSFQRSIFTMRNTVQQLKKLYTEPSPS